MKKEFYKNTKRYKACLSEWMRVLVELRSGKEKTQIEQEMVRKPGYVNNVIRKLKRDGLVDNI